MEPYNVSTYLFDDDDDKTWWFLIRQTQRLVRRYIARYSIFKKHFQFWNTKLSQPWWNLYEWLDAHANRISQQTKKIQRHRTITEQSTLSDPNRPGPNNQLCIKWLRTLETGRDSPVYPQVLCKKGHVQDWLFMYTALNTRRLVGKFDCN